MLICALSVIYKFLEQEGCFEDVGPKVLNVFAFDSLNVTCTLRTHFDNNIDSSCHFLLE